MFKKISYLTLAFAFIPLVLGWASLPVHASVEIGKIAPTFTATDIHGNTFSLEDHKGKIIVLEWTNHLCPFVKKHYVTNNMQNTQKIATDNGVIWVSIVSSAEGNLGHVSPEEAIEIEKQANAHATTRILDPSGEIGRLYAAKTTPHMFIISAEGKLAYAGAMDGRPSPNPASIKGATNLVLAALDDLSTGRVVQIPRTAPYGCAVKY
ncbi:MAG: thioredoxin family protein [Zetaproteobacteria bacterium]|nr:MAG: thioredoxin family protein [Zetaproteobacteria bacterium]